MKVLIVYDSEFGNTQQIAEAIAESIKSEGEVRLLKPSQVAAEDLQSLDLLVVGTPTQGGRPTVKIGEFIARLPEVVLRGVSSAVFDTRFDSSSQGYGLKLLMRTIGYGAPKIAAALVSKGARIVVEPEGFIVEDKQGPLRLGEIEQARQWSRRLMATLSGQTSLSA